jgi:hypothetical protein
MMIESTISALARTSQCWLAVCVQTDRYGGPVYTPREFRIHFTVSS